MELRQMADDALALCKSAGAEYADLRLVRARTEAIDVKSGAVHGYRSHKEVGIGVRVLIDGAWGFAGNPDLEWKKIKLAAERAVAMARASASCRHEPIRLAAVEPVRAKWNAPLSEDPFEVPLEQKIDLLMRCDAAMARVPEVAVRNASMDFYREWKLFVSTEGAEIEQTIVYSGGGMTALVLGDGEAQTRSFPQSFRGQHVLGGYEVVRQMGLAENAERTAREACDLVKAPECPTGVTTILLGKSQLALQVHESCGHPTELDRVFGYEANYAGTSFLTPDKLGHYRYGSPEVTIVADATCPGGLGTYAYDDEGVPGQRFDLIRDGIFVGYQTSRETAHCLEQASNGTMRAQGWNNLPLIRMTNINLEPGDVSFEDLLADTDDGILLEDNSSWSIDDKRLNFQFGCEVGWLVKKGKIVGMVKNPTYTGITPVFWGRCDAVTDEKKWHVWGTPNCGKGQPGQSMRVGHGVSYARFRDVEVGVVHGR